MELINRGKSLLVYKRPTIVLWNSQMFDGMIYEAGEGIRPISGENFEMAEIGKPERRRVLVPEETPTPPRVVPEPKTPVKVPEREPA